MTAYAKAGLVLALLLIGFFCGWLSQGWRKDSAMAAQTIKAGQETVLLQQARDKAAADKVTEIQQIQKDATDAITDKQAALDTLSNCLRTAACRLRYGPATVYNGNLPKAGANAGGGDAAGGELDAAAQSAYLALRAGIERQAIALRTCQMYAEEVQK